MLANIRLTLQAPMPIEHKGVQLDCGYRLDLLIEDPLTVELKAVGQLFPIHHA